MKKIFMSIFAIAAVGMVMTSCNKEESATAEDLYLPFENSEVMNMAKTHFVGDDQFFDNGDRIYIMDGSNNIANYIAATNDGGATAHLVFERNIRGNFNVNNGTLTAFYPTSIVYNSLPNEVRLPSRQTTVAGEINNFPLWGQGTIEEFEWKNLCGLVTFRMTGDVAIDSISITTDKFINGHFKVNAATTNMLSYQSGGYAVLGHGTKTNTLVFRTPMQLDGTVKEASIFLPGATYKAFTITFYSNGTKRVVRNNVDVNIVRENYSRLAMTLNSADFVEFTNGAAPAEFNVGGGKTVIFSQGNLEYVSSPNQYWQFADNQWDFRGRYQSKDANNQYDRDLFAWGANGYFVNGHHRASAGYDGNDLMLWAVNNEYAHCTATELLNEDEWGNNKIANADKQINSGWRTLTQDEMEYLLDNYETRMVTLSFVGKKGLILFPTAVTPCANNANLTKSEWNALEAAGCIFFVADNYRMATGRIANRIPTTGTMSYYWLNTAADANTASALIVDQTNDATVVDNANKKIGGFVRLVKDVE